MVEENYIVNVNDIVVFYGINNSNLQLLRTLFNDLSITARGTSIKVIGEESRVSEFIDKIQLLELAFQEKGFLNEKTIISIVKNGDSD
ncbi:MAG: phosphate starvation-inducible protein PhoH, partial [Paludibacteraceae bacterium]|nr:phosphate starvation-inducible protein PhoH [Paludibacteraceae bacterium]